MMLKLILCFLFCLPFSLTAQRKYSQAELNRLADLGKLWGTIHNFHPAMVTGAIITDSLIVRNAASLAENPSKENFKRAVEDMLGQLKDKHTRIDTKRDTSRFVIFSPHPDSVAFHPMTNGVMYISCPTAAIQKKGLFRQKMFSVDSLSKYRGVIFDLRNQSAQGMKYDEQFMNGFLQNYLGRLLNEGEYRPVQTSRIHHSGFISQTYRTGNIYSSGWRTESESPDYNVNFSASKLTVPIAFVINSEQETGLIKMLQTLRYAEKCLIIYEGNPLYYDNISLTMVPLADSINVMLKTGIFTIGNNQLVHEPDTIVHKVEPGSLFMETCSKFLLSKNPASKKTIPANLEYVHPRLAKTNTAFAGTGQRLLGLYNFWNAVEYFFPSKNLTGNNWDSILYQYIPRFIHATDTINYFQEILSLVSEIHDSHAFVNSLGMFNKNLYEHFFYRPPVKAYFIGGKVYIISLAKDAMNDLSPLNVWDEIVKVNGIPVMHYAEKFRKFFSASNETAYYHDVCTNYLLMGENGTTVNITLKRGNKTFTVPLLRSSNFFRDMNDSVVNFAKKYPVSAVLPGNMGYINMDLLEKEQIDSVMNALWNTRGIIIDLRNYPNGTAWSLSPYFTDQPVAANLNKSMQVSSSSYEYVNRMGNTLSSYNVVMPRSGQKKYSGKVVVLCNEFSMSQSEYSVMMIQAASQGTVIGSQTMGADGNISEIYFPGGYYTRISALGVYYPDGTETQRVGVKINIPLKPTLDGLKAGKDEVLERAKQFLNTGK